MLEMEQKLVSVCIASYNGQEYIQEQIDSILSQIGNNDEIIISDDGSTDYTLDIIRKINDRRITLVSNTKRNGIIGNFENALVHASGKYIFLCDQDDIWLPHKYKRMLEELKTYDLVHSDSIVTNESLDTIYPSFYEIYKNGTGIIKNIVKSTYFGSHMAFKKEILEYALPFPATDEIGHDLWIGIVTELVGKVSFIDDKLLLYRRHDTAYCDLAGKSKRALREKIHGRIQMVKYILKFCIEKKGTKKFYDHY